MKQYSGIGNQGFIKGFLLLVLLAGIGYVGISFGAPYYRFNTLRSTTKDILSQENPVQQNIPLIKEKILAEARKLNVPLSESGLTVVLSNEKVFKVRATWSETVNFRDYYSKRLDFDMDTEY